MAAHDLTDGPLPVPHQPAAGHVPYSGTQTDQQRAATDRLCDDWMATALSTQRCDRPAAERAVLDAYAAAGFTRPPITFWMDSPLGGVLATTVLPGGLLQPQSHLHDQLRGGDHLLHWLHAQLEGQLGHKRWNQLLNQLWIQLDDRLRGEMRERLQDQLWDARGALRDRLVGELLRQLRVQLGSELRSQLWDRQLGGQLQANLEGQLWDALWSPLCVHLGDQLNGTLWGHLGGALYGHLDPWHEAFWLALHTRARDIAGLPRSHQLETMAAAIRHTGWWWPMEGAVVLTDRPTTLRRDQQGRLHCATGPALAYADGYDGHWWHGVRVPADLVIGDGWAPDRILGEHNAEIRRCAIEKRGWDRFVHDAGLAQVGDDAPDPGNPGQVLRLYELPTRLADIYAGRAHILVVANASLDRDGTRRTFGIPIPAHIGDPITAAATTFGVDTAEYRSLARAT